MPSAACATHAGSQATESLPRYQAFILFCVALLSLLRPALYRCPVRRRCDALSTSPAHPGPLEQIHFSAIRYQPSCAILKPKTSNKNVVLHPSAPKSRKAHLNTENQHAHPPLRPLTMRSSHELRLVPGAVVGAAGRRRKIITRCGQGGGEGAAVCPQDEEGWDICSCTQGGCLAAILLYEHARFCASCKWPQWAVLVLQHAHLLRVFCIDCYPLISV